MIMFSDLAKIPSESFLPTGRNRIGMEQIKKAFARYVSGEISYDNYATNYHPEMYEINNENLSAIDALMANIKTLSSAEGYNVFGTEKELTPEEWGQKQGLTEAEAKRMLKNIDIYRNNLFCTSKSKTPYKMLIYTDYEKISEILNSIAFELNNIINNYKYCGDLECGKDD